MNKNCLEGIKNSAIWKKDFKNVGETIDNGVMQDKNIPDFAKAIQLIIRTADVLKENAENHLKKYDLSIAQKGVLAALYGCGENNMTQIRLSKFVYSSKANVSSILDRMEKKDFIKREENPVNKREKKVMLTKKGKDLIEKLLADSIDMPIEKILTSNEAKTLILLLNKVRIGQQEVLNKK